jgi:GxxExxY protein
MDERDPLTAAILGAAFEVSNTLGHGFLEKVYHKALLRELALRGLNTASEVSSRVSYKEEEIATYVADLVIEGAVIVELKCAEKLLDAHVSQCLNYLRASGLTTALLLNFGRPRVEYRRVALSS